MNDSPAVQFYPKDFLVDANVVCLTNEELGAYVRLLCHCWIEESLPADDKKLAKLSNCFTRWGHVRQSVISLFQKTGHDRYTHKRLTEERKKQKEHREERRRSGKRGAEKRWENTEKLNSLAIAQPIAKNSSAMQQPIAKNASPSPSPSPSLKDMNFSDEKVPCAPPSKNGKTTTKNTYSAEFEQFWKAYPVKNGKLRAYQAFKKLKFNDEFTLSYLIGEVVKHEKIVWSQPNAPNRVYAEGYLKYARWEDEKIPPVSRDRYGKAEEAPCRMQVFKRS